MPHTRIVAAPAQLCKPNLHHANPDGMAGNEDVGQMFAWFLLSALGFYSVDPVSATYVLGSPVIDRATLTVNNGQTLTITVKNNPP